MQADGAGDLPVVALVVAPVVAPGVLVGAPVLVSVRRVLGTPVFLVPAGVLAA